MNRRWLPALLLVVALGAASAARGQGIESPPTAAQPDPEAVRLYEEGQRYFKIGEYEQAIERLKAAYLKAPLPELLYDLGQAFRLKGDCAEALSFYRRFTAAAPPGLRLERTNTRIAEMEECVARKAPAPATIVPEAIVSSSPVVPASTPLLAVRDANPVDRPAGHRRLALAAGVAASALAITSGTFGWRALDASDEVAGSFVPGNTWTATSHETERRGIFSERVAIATGVGALLAAGVAAWLYWR